MRLFIHHRTEYRFTEPQARVVQMLRMTPDNCRIQNIVDWRIDIDCDARLKPSRDGFGNIISMLYLQGPIERVGISVTGEVLTEDRAGVISGAMEPLPPAVFLRPTELTGVNPAIVEIAAPFGKGPAEPLERAHLLNTTIHELIACTPHRSTETRTAADVVRSGAGCSMDIAHVLIAAARTAGFPARFVTGYIYCDDDGIETSQAPQFWTELYVPEYGWIGFDPVNDRCPHEAYVRVAQGLDYRDAAPISGARIGGGHEVLSVGVDVSLSASQTQAQA
jgi:transglutaminase-like putative cysteine protease